MSLRDCLMDIVGMSRNECTCYEADRPVDFNESPSGLYLDELDGLELKTINADQDCDDGNVWDKMERALEEADNALITDLMACIHMRTDNRRNPFTGEVGERSFRQDLSITEQWAGVKIETRPIEGGCIILNGVSTFMNATDTFTLYIYNNIEEDALFEIPGIQATANVIQPNVFSTPIELPLCRIEEDDLEYYLIYEPNGFQPKDNELECTCKKGQNWDEWVDFDGIFGDDLANRQFSQDTHMHGLLLQIDIRCKATEIICKDGEVLKFDGEDKLPNVLAWAKRYKAAEILISNILASGNINRFTMMKGDHLMGMRNRYRKEYKTRIDYLCHEADITKNDCLVCDDERIQHGSILT